MPNTNVPIPQRGQPLDLTYIYNLANAVNELSASISSSIEKYVTVDTPAVGKISVKSSDAKIIAAYQEINSDSTVTADSEKTFSYSFETPFKFAPIATVSPVNIGDTDAGENVRVILTQVTTTRVDGVVKFGATGKATIGVNIIVVGIPN
jgi:hypothetical protein